MMNKARHEVCPHCGSENLKIYRQGEQQLVYCYDCDRFFERSKSQSYVPRRLSDLGRPYREPDPDDSPDSEQFSE